MIARVVNTMLEPRELLEAIALDFGLADVSKSKPVLVRDLGLFLVEQRRQGRRPLLVIDEAQNLSPQALEEVRLLSNLETEKSKLLQILLAGQPNLRDTIASPELEQFRQRIAVSYHLRRSPSAKRQAYINFRLNMLRSANRCVSRLMRAASFTKSRRRAPASSMSCVTRRWCSAMPRNGPRSIAR